jgi:hypothetical protein
MAMPPIARHLPRFCAAPPASWPRLLADTSGTRAEQLNIPVQENGFGTVCASFITLPRQGGVEQKFAAGPPCVAEFEMICPGVVCGTSH